MANVDYTKGVWNPSPNYWKGDDTKNGRLPLTDIVLHGTAGFAPGCLQWLCRPNGNSSAHYLVARDGTAYQLVHESDSAWANGAVSAGGIYPASPNPNRHTISIETENDGANSLAYTAVQRATVVDLIKDIRRRHGPLRLIPHSAIDPVNRPFCPGPKVDLAAIDKEATVPVTTTYLLAHWPYQSQLANVSNDGNPPEDAADDCGPACLSMILEWGLGLHITPDAIKDEILGQGTIGYTYVTQLSDYLNARGVTTHWEQDPSAIVGGKAADGWLSLGHPTIVLLYADRTAQTGGHFVTLVGKNSDGSRIVANPWTGGPETLTPSGWAQAYAGYVLHAALPAYNPTPAPTPQPSGGGKFLVLRDMLARKQPVQDATPANVYFLPSGQPQVVHAGAVLQGTGQQTPHWISVTASGHPCWLWLQNLRAV